MTQERDFTDRIASTIADSAQQDVTELDPPLYDAIDADALVEVIQSDAVREVEFSYLDYTVVVDEEGEVCVSEVEPARRRKGKLG